MAGPFNLLEMGLLAGAVLGACAGGLYGAFGGMLYGVGLTDRHLQKLAESLKDGGTVVTTEVGGWRARNTVAQIFLRHGAIQESKTVVM